MLPCLVLVVNSDQLQSYLHAHTTLAAHSYALLHDDVIKSYTDTELGALLGTGIAIRLSMFQLSMDISENTTY